MFKLRSKFRPTGDQPQAIENLTKNLKEEKNSTRIQQKNIKSFPNQLLKK